MNYYSHRGKFFFHFNSYEMEDLSKLTQAFMIKCWLWNLYSLEILKIITFGNHKFTLAFIHEFNKTFIENLHAAVIYSQQ